LTSKQHVEITFLAEKVYLHHWPLGTPKWSDSTIRQIDLDLNKNKEKKQITINGNSVQINNYEFQAIKNVGVSIPLFKKQCILVFEGYCKEFDAHAHITTKEENYLETFNKLMHWRTNYFPDTVYVD
jgi:hypothetical protein